MLNRKKFFLLGVLLITLGVGFVGTLLADRIFHSSSQVVIVNNDPGLKATYYPEDSLWKKFISDLGIFKENGVLVDLEGQGITLVTVKKIKVFIEPAIQAIPMVKEIGGNTVVSWDLDVDGGELVMKINVNYKLFDEKRREKLTNDSYEQIISYRLAGLSAKYYSEGTYSTEQQWEILNKLIDFEKIDYLTVSVL